MPAVQDKGKVTKSMADSHPLHLNVDIFFKTAFSARSTPLLFTHLCRLSCAAVAHWDAFGCGSAPYTCWYQMQFIFTTCEVRYHTVLV